MVATDGIRKEKEALMISFLFYGTRKENKSKGPPALMAEGGKLEDKFQ